MLESVGYVGSRSSSSISKAVAAHHVSLVIQRYRSCRLMRNEVEWVHQGQPLLAPTGSSDRGVSLEIGLDSSLSPPSSSSSSTHCGLLIYISFATGANRSHAALAAETVWNLPVLTTGLWGDGVSEQHSLRALLLQGTKANPEFHYQTSITIVPQANLICKVRQTSGKMFVQRSRCHRRMFAAFHFCSALTRCIW